MLTEIEPPGTSTPVEAFTNLTICEPLLPVTHNRPREVTFIGDPIVNFMPTQPLKSLRKDWPPSAYPVTKLFDGNTGAIGAIGAIGATTGAGTGRAGAAPNAAVTECGDDIVIVCDRREPRRSPVQLRNTEPVFAAADSWTVLPSS